MSSEELGRKRIEPLATPPSKKCFPHVQILYQEGIWNVFE
jgi:hypothetical protein